LGFKTEPAIYITGSSIISSFQIDVCSGKCSIILCVHRSTDDGLGTQSIYEQEKENQQIDFHGIFSINDANLHPAKQL